MRALLLRVGALGTLVVLGWIAIANAQRDRSTADDATASETPGVAEQPLRPRVTPSTGGENPLRPSARPTTQPYPSSTPRATEPNASRPAADPFGLQARRNGASSPPAALPAGDTIPDAPSRTLPPPRNVAESPRYQQKAAAASADQPLTGTTQVPDTINRSANERYANRSDRTADRGSQRYAAPATSDTQEPGPFKADPFAIPANAPRTTTSESGGLAAIPENSRGPELAAENDGTGQPGSKQLEGVQSPQLTIQKVAPKEIQVGKPAAFRVTVRNVGQAPAGNVEIRDQIPKGTRLVSTAPPATRGPHGEIIWAVGTVPPGKEVAVEMQLMPTAEGEIGSVATVHFGAEASARTIATRPQLVVKTEGPKKVLINDQVVLQVTISNPGTGVATGVVLDERIPPGLQHPAGAELEYPVGDLKPGESRKLELPLVAGQAGPVTNVINARAAGDLRAEPSSFDLEVLAPQLNVAVKAPKRSYLERQATYQFSVANPGTASAKQVELVASLPPGLKFVSANNAGYYEEANHTVRWRLEELPANEEGQVKLVTMPVAAGEQAITVSTKADKGLSAVKKQPVLIEGVAAVLFQVTDTADPIEVGGETTYEVRLLNQGSKAAGKVQLTMDLPAEVKPMAADAPTQYRLEGNRVVFDALAQLAPKAEATFRLRAKAVRPGDLRARFLLQTDEMQSPVTKEESTRVYADD